MVIARQRDVTSGRHSHLLFNGAWFQMMVLSTKLGHCSDKAQADIIAAFVNSDLQPGEKI
jgi:hypothetical protein